MRDVFIAEGVCFEEELLGEARRLIQDFLVLGESCLVGGIDATIQLVQSRLVSRS